MMGNGTAAGGVMGNCLSVWGQLLRWHGDGKWECNGGVMGICYIFMGSTANVAWRWEMGVQRGSYWYLLNLYGVNC
jgi:hypothetical protein